MTWRLGPLVPGADAVVGTNAGPVGDAAVRTAGRSGDAAVGGASVGGNVRTVGDEVGASLSIGGSVITETPAEQTNAPGIIENRLNILQSRMNEK